MIQAVFLHNSLGIALISPISMIAHSQVNTAVLTWFLTAHSQLSQESADCQGNKSEMGRKFCILQGFSREIMVKALIYSTVTVLSKFHYCCSCCCERVVVYKRSRISKIFFFSSRSRIRVFVVYLSLQ